RRGVHFVVTVVTVPVVDVAVVVGSVVVLVVVTGAVVPPGQSTPEVVFSSRQLFAITVPPDRALEALKTSLVTRAMYSLPFAETSRSTRIGIVSSEASTRSRDTRSARCAV